MASEDEFESFEGGTSKLEFMAELIHNNPILLVNSTSGSKREDKIGDYGASTKICQYIW